MKVDMTPGGEENLRQEFERVLQAAVDRVEHARLGDSALIHAALVSSFAQAQAEMPEDKVAHIAAAIAGGEHVDMRTQIADEQTQ
jgi:hypothetical protein